ncbi:MAG: DUF2442 domain-containing protein [Anaerolineales bacterium]|nr:DUF2442 domain-containing protein [Anaerolineales bacterium]
MSHPLYDVLSFQIIAPYTLLVTFDDGTKQTINFEPVLYGEVYGHLKDIELFNQVRLDEEIRTLIWPNGADFDPWVLHEWPKLAKELSARARSWELQKV